MWELWGARWAACMLLHRVCKEDFPLTPRGFALGRDVQQRGRPRQSLCNREDPPCTTLEPGKKTTTGILLALFSSFWFAGGKPALAICFFQAAVSKALCLHHGCLCASIARTEPGEMDYLSKGRADLLDNFLASSLQTGVRTQIQSSPCLIMQSPFYWPDFTRKSLY